MRLCSTVKHFLFRLVDLCNSKKEQEMIIKEFVVNSNNIDEANRILSLESQLRAIIEQMRLDNNILHETLMNILDLYESKNIDEMISYIDTVNTKVRLRN